MIRYGGKLIGVITLCVLFALHGAALAENQPTYYPTEPIGSKSGYLIIDLSLSRNIGTIVIERLVHQRKTMIDVFVKDKIEIGPYDSGRHMQLLVLPAGLYSLSQIRVPHYDLPYLIDHKSDPRWRFTIQTGELNYLGQILVDEYRSSGPPTALLLNRIAATMSELEVAFSDQLSEYPLRYAGIYRDSYFESVLDTDEAAAK